MGIGELVSGFGEKVKAAPAKMAAFIHERRVYAFCVVGAILIILVLLIILQIVKHEPAKAAVAPAPYSAGSAPASVKPSDFFMSDEPDFVPGVLLGREPADGWVEEDARPFWTDPLEGN
jgi:hypothetical protein